MYIPVHSIYGTTMQILPNREGSRKGGWGLGEFWGDGKL